jgi:hypothetical protein
MFMKAFKVVLGAFLASGAMVSAQEISTPTGELWSNYSWCHRNSSNNDRAQIARNRVSGYCEHNLNQTAGLVVSFCDYANTKVEIDELLMPSLFVPLSNSRHANLHRYAQFPFDGTRVWNSPTGISMARNAIATSAEELDYHRTKHISIKSIGMEYVLTKSTNGFGSFQNDAGYSGSVVFKFRRQ